MKKMKNLKRKTDLKREKLNFKIFNIKNSIIFIFFILSLTLISAQSNELYFVSAKSLNMRSGAGTEFTVVKTLAQNDTVVLVEKNLNGWWFVNFKENSGYVSSKLLIKDPNIGWDKKDYYSGQTPECINVEPRFDYSIDNYLKINVGSNTDVVVKLMEKGTSGLDVCIRMAYVRSDELVYLKNIPEGKYYLRIAYGKDWRQKIEGTQCKGKFIKNAMYQNGKEILDFKIIRKSGGNEIPYFELNLDLIISDNSKSNFRTSTITEAQFNK